MEKWFRRLRQFRDRSPLSFRILTYILLFSSLFTLVTSATQIYTDFRNDVSLVDERMSVIETSYSSSLARSLWALDQKLLEVQMEGILSLPDIVHLDLTIYPDSRVRMGDLSTANATRSSTIELVHQTESESYELGELTITASMDTIYQDLRRKIVVILATQFLKTFFVSILIIWIFQHFVTRHLQTMAEFARRFSIHNRNEPLRLDRADTASNRRDELSQVVDAFNHMRERLEEDVQKQELDAAKIRKLSKAVEQSPSSVLICDRNWRIEFCNQKFCQISGHEPDAIHGKHPELITADSMSPRDNNQLWENIRLQVRRVGVWQGEIQSTRTNGERFWQQVVVTPIYEDDGPATHYLILGEDISIRKRYEQQLLRQANYDILTGLPNRMLALDRLKLALAQAQREGTLVAVLFLDLDNFKHINDTMGHEAGDNLLIEAARRISSCLRGTSTVARLGGDEFLVILPGIKDASATEQVGERILNTFSPPIQISGQEIFVSTSIGIALYPDDSDASGNLLQYADAAMYQAKSQGKSAYQRFRPEMKAISYERLQMESNLRRALELDELELHYQPVVRTSDGLMAGAEALLRWRNAELGMVGPDRFIPLAEETGLIIPIGAWVIRQACLEARRWQQLTGQPFFIAVNVSPRQFRDPGFVDLVNEALQEAGLPAGQLELEITERLILDDSIEASDTLSRLDELGVRLSVDDFGTGYSALSYLKSYPFDTLKIDKTFIGDVMIEEDDAALVRAIITMAHSLGLEVIAEGVEDESQTHFLQDHGCDFSQGYFYCRPIVADEFVEWIQTNTRAAGQSAT
ncbi:diguanylate cyclase [Tamilnaduibacter salinus]|uniref:cyclic-guanylate-specific phosphodiesterase n=1 Tax=Tamilnaduibacter salinus TaxID=1484056 RepID=A0A2A2I4P1_9GAMM|nr:EAL domain-containing protein [Tamilnaduibacter salinus]PAV26266.1 diguanylate cyclase [Tamilnaduibacter salinus]